MGKRQCIAVLGGDARQAYAAQALQCAGWQVRQYQVPRLAGLEAGEHTKTIQKALRGAAAVVGPVPFRADHALLDTLCEHMQPGQTLIAGHLPPKLTERCRALDAAAYDLLLRDDYAILNAIATAEGAIAEAILHSGGNLHLSECLVLGYGRCAKPLAKKLLGLDVRVTVAARRWEAACAAIADGCEALDFAALAQQLPRFSYIFNTIPSLVLGEPLLLHVSPQAVLIDIASAPGGIDFAAAQQLGLTAKLCPGLPGKYAPRVSGEYIAQTVQMILKEQEGAAWGRNRYGSASD